MCNAWPMMAALALVAMVPNASAWAACEPFTAYSNADAREVAYADVNSDGIVNEGDKRFGRVTVLDAQGKKIGVSYLTATIHEGNVDGGPGPRSMEIIYLFDDGVLFTAIDVITNGFTNFKDGGQRPKPDTSLGSTIIGGLDAYAGAHGTVKYEPKGMDSTYTFDLSCK